VHSSFLRHRGSLGNADFELLIYGPVVEVAVLELVEHVDDVRIVGANNVIVDDYLVLIDCNRLAGLIIACLKDVQDIGGNIIACLRALD
jgi:hypothetical protein